MVPLLSKPRLISSSGAGSPHNGQGNELESQRNEQSLGTCEPGWRYKWSLHRRGQMVSLHPKCSSPRGTNGPSDRASRIHSSNGAVTPPLKVSEEKKKKLPNVHVVTSMSDSAMNPAAERPPVATEEIPAKIDLSRVPARGSTTMVVFESCSTSSWDGALGVLGPEN